jgi:hypothetical protein
MLVLLGFVRSDILPSIHWDYDSKRFDKAKCPLNEMRVKSGDSLNLICPTPHLIDDQVSSDTSTEQLMDMKIYMSTSEDDYNNCNSTNAMLIHTCRSPEASEKKIIDYKTLWFHQMKSSKDDPDYKEGGYYYYYTTSDGEVKNLEQRVGGKCATHNLKMKVYFCKSDEECKREIECPSTTTTAVPSQTPATNASDNKVITPDRAAVRMDSVNATHGISNSTFAGVLCVTIIIFIAVGFGCGIAFSKSKRFSNVWFHPDHCPDTNQAKCCPTISSNELEIELETDPLRGEEKQYETIEVNGKYSDTDMKNGSGIIKVTPSDENV